MIKIRAMHDLYTMYLSKNIEHLTEKVETQTVLIQSYLKELSKIKPFIENYVNYNDLLNGKVQRLPSEFKTTIPNYGFNNIIIKNYYAIYTGLIEYEEQIKSFKRQKVSYAIYKNVISKFNDKVLDYLIDTGKAFENKYFGSLRLFYRSKEGTQYKVNWNLSMKKKQELIDEGKIPYSEVDRIKAAKEGREYNGEKWFVRGFDTGLLYYRWYVPDVIKEELKREIYNFRFLPSRGNYGAVSKLVETYRNPDYDYSKYIVS